MSGKKKAWIGASGGLALSIMFLMKSGFLISASFPDLLGGGLTCLAFIVLGAFVGGYAPETVPMKLFIYGLLAPSILTNIVAKQDTSTPIGSGAIGGPTLQIEPLNKDASLPYQRRHLAFSQRDTNSAHIVLVQGQASSKPQNTPVMKLPKPKLSADIAVGALKFLGRKPDEKSAFVVGVAKDSNVAQATAKRLKVTYGNAVQIIAPEQSPYQFITIGGLQGMSYAVSIGNQAKRHEMRRLSSPSASNLQPVLRKLSIRVLGGVVLNASALSAYKPQTAPKVARR